jgi:hypothetical protein
MVNAYAPEMATLRSRIRTLYSVETLRHYKKSHVERCGVRVATGFQSLPCAGRQAATALGIAPAHSQR